MLSTVDFTDRRSSARTTSKDDLGFTAPLVSGLCPQLAPEGCGVPVKPSVKIIVILYLSSRLVDIETYHHYLLLCKVVVPCRAH